MRNEQNKAAIENGMRTLWIVWGAALISLFIYLVVAHLLGEEIRHNQNPNFPLSLMRNILLGIGIATLFGAYFLKKTILSQGSRTVSKAILNDQSNSDPTQIIAKYTTATIISLALCESVGIYGFVLYILDDNLQTLYSFIGLSAVAIIYYRPKKEELKEAF